MINRCQKAGMRKPEFRIDGGFFILRVWRKRAKKMEPELAPSRHQAGTKLGLSSDQVNILRKCLQESKISELMKIASRTNRTKFRDQVLTRLIHEGFLEMTVPDKPRSSKQKYRITKKGAEYLRKRGKK